jgi:methyl-accepting chemotaxis protein
MNDLRTTIRDAGYVAVGLGVIGFQQLQVRRRELERQFGTQFGDVRTSADRLLSSANTTLDDSVKLVEERLQGLGGLGEQVDKAVEQLSEQVERAVEQFGKLAEQVRPTTKV